MAKLASNILLFLQVDDLWIYTASETEGVIMDPCKGDSGGPLFIDNGGQPILVGVLQVTLTASAVKTKLKHDILYQPRVTDMTAPQT